MRGRISEESNMDTLARTERGEIEFTELDRVSAFPAGSPGILSASQLRDFTRSIRRIRENLTHEKWVMLSLEERLFLRRFAIGVRNAKPSAGAIAKAKITFILHPEEVQDFMDARAELRVVIMRMAAKDEWQAAFADPNFVEASDRGLAGVAAGRVRTVRREDL